MKETNIVKYTCGYCGYMTIVHGDEIFKANTKEQAQEHEDNCCYNPIHKKCAACKHRMTNLMNSTAICFLKTDTEENKEKGLYISVCIGDSCSKWELNARETPWYDHKNKRKSIYLTGEDCINNV